MWQFCATLKTIIELLKGMERMLDLIRQKRDEVDGYFSEAKNHANLLLAKYREQLATNAAKANAMSPLSVLSRGYSVAESKDGVVKSAEQIKVDDELQLIFADGRAKVNVREVEKGELFHE